MAEVKLKFIFGTGCCDHRVDQILSQITYIIGPVLLVLTESMSILISGDP